MLLFLAAGQAIGGTNGLDHGPGPRQRHELHHVLLLRPHGAQDVPGPGGHREGGARSSTRWWTGSASGPGCRCPSWRWPRTTSPTRSPPGRSPEKAVVAVTTGILKYMPQEELEGVIAHELAHIKNRDMLITTIAAGIAGAISLPALPVAVRRRPPGRRGRAPRGPDRHRPARPDRGDDHPDGRLPPARVCRRPHGAPRSWGLPGRW